MRSPIGIFNICEQVFGCESPIEGSKMPYIQVDDKGFWAADQENLE